MQLILYLLQKYRNFLVFLLLELIAVSLTLQLHSYHRSKFINSANAITGGVYNHIISINEYLHLKKENTLLINENARLKNIILQTQNIDTTYIQDSIHPFIYTDAQIINNTFTKQHNFLTINKGKNQSVDIDMGVVNDKGVIGITSKSSSNYTAVMSILNKSFQINAKFKKSDYYGTITWNGAQINTVQLMDIPRQANVTVGDTIITGGKSTIFPESIHIGVVSNILYHNNRYQRIDVNLFNDLRNIKNVHIIKNTHQQEIRALERSVNE